MKICKCQFCGTITKVDWTQGPLPSCPNCQGVFDLEDIYDEEDADFDEDEEEDYGDYDEDTQSMRKTIIDWARDHATSLVALAFLIGSFVCFGWFLASEKTYATQDAIPNNNSAGGAEVRLVDNIIIENGEEGVKYEITAGLVDVDTERSETEENETESQDTKTIKDK